MQVVDFGKTGLRVSRLNFGTGTRGWGGRSEQTDLGTEELTKLLRHAYDIGVTFWDTADAYGSHPHVAKALQGIPRDDVVIATKTTSRSAQDVTRDVDRFLNELDTDVLDIVLLHYMTDQNWPQGYAGAIESLSRAKEQGKVRAVGVSCHGLGPLRAAAASDWVEVILVRINYAGVNMDGSPDEVEPIVAEMHQDGKAVYGMKVLGAGRLANDARRAVQHVLQLGTVYSITIGTSSWEQLDRNSALVEELAPQHPPLTLDRTLES
jgi:aryl-alcohol dehydrogenase-like predicted oxidoreductase